MQDDLNRLIKRPPPEIRLDVAKSPPAIREQTGLERQQTGVISGEEVTVQSTDGLFTFVVRVVKAS